jgi:hypothetical protein
VVKERGRKDRKGSKKIERISGGGERGEGGRGERREGGEEVMAK